MKPVRTERSNFTFKGPTPDIGDLPCRVEDLGTVVFSTWTLSPEERVAIAEGSNIELGVWTYRRGFPPVSLEIDDTPIDLGPPPGETAT